MRNNQEGVKDSKPKMTQMRKVMRALRKLNVSYNPIISRMPFANNECAMIGGGTDGSYDNPDDFNEAWNHPDVAGKKHWRTKIRNEFNNMIKRKVWRQTKTNKIPKEIFTDIRCGSQR